MVFATEINMVSKVVAYMSSEYICKKNFLEFISSYTYAFNAHSRNVNRIDLKQ